MAAATLTIETGFAPIIGDSPRFLVLGSMPGVKSLADQRYYAHPRNAFWPIMATLFDFDSALAYEARCALLTQSGVAVWDVLQACHRPGSLDANIDNATMVINDFKYLFEQHPSFSHVFFNGAKAESVFQHVLPTLSESQLLSLSMQRLPSTSPAHAAMSFEQKLGHWETAFIPAVT